MNSKILFTAKKRLQLFYFYILLFLGSINCFAQNVSATWGANNNSAWYTGGNWAGGTYPGLQGSASSNTNTATFTSAYTATQVGINMNTANLNLGAIHVDNTRSTAMNIGNSGGSSSGVLRLYGATVNSIANTILRNNGTALFTLQATQSGGGTMGIVLSNATENIINCDGTGGISITSIISGSGALTKTGANALTLVTGNTYTGKTKVNAGTIIGSGESIFGASPASFTPDQITFNGGTLQSSGGLSFSSNRGLTIGSGGATFNATSGNDITLTNITTGSGAITKTGTGKLILAGVHTFTGLVTVSTGTLQLSGAGNFYPDASALSVSTGAFFDLNGNSETIGSLAGTGTVNSSTTGNIILTTGGDNTSTIFSGVMQNGTATSLGFTKTGTGTMTLSGANTYTGATTVSAGELTVNGSLASTSAVTVTGTSTTTLSGAGAVGATTISSNGVISPAGSGTAGTLTTGALTLNAGGSYTCDISGLTTTSCDKIAVTGNITTPTSGTFTINASLSAVSGTFNSATAYSWFIGTYTGSASVTNLALNVTGVTYTGTFSLTASGGNLTLVYTPLPCTTSLTSSVGTNAQSVCINTAITNITYSTVGTSSATFAGLPTGVTGAWASNVVTISGTPSVSGVFTYTVTLSCGTTTNGTITVSPKITLSSVVGTDAQTVCTSTAITAITYSTVGITAASFSGLPTGVSGAWASNTATISGTPSSSGSFTYTITATSTCGTPTATGTIVVNQASIAPTSLSTSLSPLCGSGSVTLTQTGGSLGTSASWKWYSNSSFTTLVGTSSLANASLTVSPSATTTYYLRAEGTSSPCTGTVAAPGSVTVTVNQASVAPTSLSASTATICNGSSTTLTQTAGSLGTLASWKWYSDASFTTLVGTSSLASASLSVSPTTTTTYYLRAEGTASPCTGTVAAPGSVTVTVNQASVAPTSLSVSTTTICNGSSTTLTQTGGSLGTSAIWKWYSDAAFTTLVGTSSSANASLSVSPTTTTTYYLRAEGTSSPCTGIVAAAGNITVTVLSTVNYGTVGGGSHIVISQVYGGGGNAGATYTNDFVELFNPTSSTVSLSSYSLQYASTSGTSWSKVSLSGSIPAGGYFLVQLQSGGANGSALPTPDLSPLTINMSATAGKIALISNQTTLGAVSCPSSVIDFVGFGTGTDCSEGSSVAPTLSATLAAFRSGSGYVDTEVNSADFTSATPSPRNSATALNASANQTSCSSGIPNSVSISGATGSGSFTYQWYSQNGIVAAPTGSSTASWTSLGTANGANTATYSPSSAVTSSVSYACMVTPSGSPTCGTATWATGVRQITVNQASVAPTSLSASTATICNGSSATLTQTGGSLGTSATWKWYSNSSFTTLVGTSSSANASLSVSPTTTTTYYLRAEGTASPCTGTIAAPGSVTVTVNQASVAPTSLSPSVSTLCGSGSVTLTQTGGSLGTSASWKWYSDASFTNLAGTCSSANASLTVSPTITTTYYLQAEGTSSPCTGTVAAFGSITVTVNQASVAPTLLNGSVICPGGSDVITQSGGSLGTSAIWKWYSDASYTTLVGTSTMANAALTVSPTVTSTYYLRAEGTLSPCSGTVTGPVSGVTVIVSPNNTINLTSAINSDAQTLCANAPITTITYTTSGATGATFAGLPSGVNGSWSSNNVTLSGTPTIAGSYTYTVTLTGGCGTIAQTGTITVNGPMATSTWTGSVSTDWFNPANWSNCVCGSTTNVTILAVTNNPTINATANLNDITINSGATLTLQSNNLLNVYGNIVNNGTLNAQTASTVALTGTTAQTMGGTVSTNFYNLTLNNSAGASLITDQGITGTLSLNLGILNTNDKLTLIASQSGSTYTVGNIGQINTLADITGQVTVQQYADRSGINSYGLLGSPIVSTLNFQDWNDNFAITCPTCPNGCCPGGVSYTSIYSYDETQSGTYDASAKYVPIANITDNIVPGKGYWVYLGNGASTSILFDVKGTVATPNHAGIVNIPLTYTNHGDPFNDGWNLISNPLPSPISWSALVATGTNIDNAIYIYNPALNSGGGGYAQYVAGVSNPAVGSGGIGDAIPIAQAFYVHLTGNASLTPAENQKINANPDFLKMNSNASITNIKPVARLFLDNVTQHDEVDFHFDANATIHFETTFDAYKVLNDPSQAYIAGVSDAEILSISGLTDAQLTSSPVIAIVPTTGTYTITLGGNPPSGICISLFDSYTGTTTNLTTAGYTCTLYDTTTTARFIISFGSTPLAGTTNVNQPVCNDPTSGFISVVGNNAGPWNYLWTDASGNIVKQTINTTNADTLTSLSSGVYSVMISTVGHCDLYSDTVAIDAVDAPVAQFTSSADTMYVNNASFNFFNTSVNATSYWWDFGDGNGFSTAIDPNYNYINTGPYIVTLIASSNTSCTDTINKIIYVLANTTGISSAPTSEIALINNSTGQYTLAYNFENAITADLKVYDVNGKIILSDKLDQIKKGSSLIDLTEQSTGIYIAHLYINNQRLRIFKLIK